MSTGSSQDLQKFVVDAYQAGQRYDVVRNLVRMAGWRISDETLSALWEALRHPGEPAAPPPANTSGMGGEIPEEICQMGWCWGGFGMGWIWGFVNNVLFGRLMLPLEVCHSISGGVPSLAGFFAGLHLANSLYLGRYGHGFAWQNRHFDSMEQFEETMKVWNLWGLCSFLIGLVIVAGVISYGVATGHFKW